jgi:hypothetical protein
MFEGQPQWSAEQRNFPKEISHGKQDDIFWRDSIEMYETENPVVQIKTGQSMRHYTKSEREPVSTLPYWGDGVDFRKKYYDIGRMH